MVDKVPSLVLASSASALSNNLAVRYLPGKVDAVAAAVVHRGVANIVPTLAAPPQIAQPSQVSCMGGSCVRPTSIMQVTFIETSTRTYFVVASTFGVQIFDEGGSVMLFSHPLGDSASPNEGSFAKGIAKLEESLGGETLTWICVGTHIGVILVFAASGLDISLASTIQAHTHPITSLAAGLTTTLVSADDGGALNVWSLGKEGCLKKRAAQQSCNWSCSTLAIYKEGDEENVVAGFGSGHLRLYKCNKLELCAEVAAHARWVTAVDVAPASLLCVSASEDSFFRVWQLSLSSRQPIQLLQNVCLPHHMLVGARFLNIIGSTVGIASYESTDIMCYSLNKISTAE